MKEHTWYGRKCRQLRCEILEPRHLLSGVTLITHGWNSGVTDWVSAMADFIVIQAGGESRAAEYTLKVADVGGAMVVQSPTRDSGTSSWEQAVLKLDWSDWDGGSKSTTDVANVVADYLTTHQFDGRWLFESAIQLIGHSRGASLNTVLAERLGQLGIWVDQVTTLDPHPVDGVREPLPFLNYGDAPMTSWKNVAFWDNYWRTEGSSSFDFTGESIANVYNLQLSESVLTGEGYSYEHSDVHLWYHGTIDTTDPISDYYITNFYPDAYGWYGGVHPARDATGFYYSRLVGGQRPLAGISAELGGTANRTAIDLSNAQWPNVLELGVSGGNLQFAIGDPIPVSYYFQDYDSAATISFSLDIDLNPYSQNAVGLWNKDVAKTGAAPVQSSDSLYTSGVPNGTYYVAAKITDPSGHTRYAYSSEPVTIVMSVYTWDGGSLVNNLWTTPENWVGNAAPSPGDDLVFPAGAARLESVNDYPIGTTFGSITVSGSGYQFHTAGSPSTSVQVEPGAQLEADKIVTGTLTIGAGAKVTISPVSSGMIGAIAVKTISQPLVVNSEVLPLNSEFQMTTVATATMVEPPKKVNLLPNQYALALRLAVYNTMFSKHNNLISDGNQTWRNDANLIHEFVHEQMQKKEQRKDRVFHQALDFIFNGYDVFEF
jgi:hypothetical protein